jgi:hypothetical protein
MAREIENVCRNCWWLSDEYTSVCVNESSPHCADFVLLNQSCAWFDPDEKKIHRPRNGERSPLPLMEDPNDE